MKYVKRIVCFFIGSVAYMTQAIAGNNPIDWVLDHSFPDPVQRGVSYSITYTFINTIPVELKRPLKILKKASPASYYGYQDNCTGQTLPPNNNTCTVTVSLNALTVGTQSVQLFIAGYDNNVVPLPKVVTSSTSGTVSTGMIATPTQALPGNMTAGSSATFTFTFTNKSTTTATVDTIALTNSTGTVTETTNSKQCLAGITLAPTDYCLVTGSYVAASTPASQSVTATMTFTGPTGSPVSATTSTFVQAPAGPVVGSVLQGLPGQMLPNTPYTVKFLFTNTTSSTDFNLTQPAASITCTVVGTGTCPSFTLSGSCSTASSIVATSQCELDTTFEVGSTTTPPTSFKLNANLAYSGPSSGTAETPQTEGTVLSTTTQTRTIKVVNNCNFEVWYSLNGGAMPAPYNNLNCPAGLGTASGNYCYFNNYVGASGQNALNPGTSDLITIPAVPPSYTGSQQWSGNISASLGCSGTAGTTCKQAACGNEGGTASCAVGVGFNQPATQAEITMVLNSTDSYDVEVINGFHIPISMQAYSYISSDGSILVPAIANNYTCGTPGNSIADNNFGACEWGTVTSSSLPNPTSYYYWVDGSGEACPSNSCSTAGELCGLAQTTPNGAITGPVCGKFLGYWTPNQLCGQQANLPAAVINGLQCNTPTGYSSIYPNTYSSLMKCPVPPAPPGSPQTNPTYNTCYYNNYPQGANVTQCCGCVDWWNSSQTKGATILANPNGALTCPAGQTDPLWTDNIQTGIQWMKAACPSVYVYPFDDGSSSFLCSNSGGTGQQNTTSYVVTFCPATALDTASSNSGLPENANEGRT